MENMLWPNLRDRIMEIAICHNNIDCNGNYFTVLNNGITL